MNIILFSIASKKMPEMWNWRINMNIGMCCSLHSSMNWQHHLCKTWWSC